MHAKSGLGASGSSPPPAEEVLEELSELELVLLELLDVEEEVLFQT